jgi:hypothetical protein
MQGCDLNKCEVVEMVKRHNMRATYTVRHRLSMVEASNMDKMVVVHALDWVHRRGHDKLWRGTKSISLSAMQEESVACEEQGEKRCGNG